MGQAYAEKMMAEKLSGIEGWRENGNTTRDFGNCGEHIEDS